MIGRVEQLDAIDDFLTDRGARALVVEGEAGIGKSTLWLAGVELALARGQAVLRARPAAVETSLAFAGLHDLLGGVSRQARERLPEVQQHALAVALAEEATGTAPVGRGVLGVAVLGLLRELAAERPLLLAIDDLQWLDESSGMVVEYVLRRLGDARVGLLAACRGESGEPLPFALHRAMGEGSLIRLPLGPMSEGAIRRMLRLRLGLDLSRIQLHTLYEATGGNPFYTLELARSSPDLDEFGTVRVSRGLQELVGVRLDALLPATRDGLLFVAALADSSPHVLARLGVLENLEPAVDAGVLEVENGRLRFSHPLVRAAAWSAADDQRRREVHRSLADAVEDPDRRARHLGAAAEAPDAGVADLLEELAAETHRRGAPAAAADLFDRACELAPADEPGRWARLAAGAAAAHAEASHWDNVWGLVEQAQARLPDGPERAAILLTAAEMRPGLEDLCRQAVVEAGETRVGVRARIGLCEQIGISARWGDAVEAAREAVALARLVGDRGLLGVALTWLGALKYLDSQFDGFQDLEEALAIEQELGSLPTSVFHSPRTYHAFALTFGDDPGCARALLEERATTASDHGDDMSAFQSLRTLVLAELLAGDWVAARETGRAALDQVEMIGYEYGRPILLGSLATLEAYEGDLERARALGTEALSALTTLGDRFWSTFALASLLLTELCAGNAARALEHAAAIADRFPDGRECWWSYHQGDEIEALVLAGEHERARDRVEALRIAGDDLALPRFLAWAERGEGLVQEARGNLAAAAAALETALEHHERFPLAFERARTLLLYGHVLRRLKRRRAARAVIGEALVELERLGARHFADVARAELKHVGGRPPAGEHELTGAEDRIAQLVATGLSNKEVATQLYVAVSTVEAALTRVYRKLGVTSAHSFPALSAGAATRPELSKEWGYACLVAGEPRLLA